jgi:soluble cytochrome b562
VETSRFTERASTSGAGVRAGLAFLAIACVTLGVAGCDEERLSKSAYEQTVRSEYASVQEAFAATRGTSGSKLAARLRGAQEALRSTAEALEGKEPPEQVEEENEELVEGMREYAEQLDELIEAAANGRESVIDRFNEELADNEAVEQMAEAAEEMKFKGYDLGRIAEE